MRSEELPGPESRARTKTRLRESGVRRPRPWEEQGPWRQCTGPTRGKRGHKAQKEERTQVQPLAGLVCAGQRGGGGGRPSGGDAEANAAGGQQPAQRAGIPRLPGDIRSHHRRPRTHRRFSYPRLHTNTLLLVQN